MINVILLEQFKKQILKKPQIGAPQLVTILQEERGITVHLENVRRVLRAEGYNDRIAREKTYINAIKRRKRLEFAKAYRSKENE